MPQFPIKKPPTALPLSREEKRRMVEAYHTSNREALIQLGLGKLVKKLDQEKAVTSISSRSQK